MIIERHYIRIILIMVNKCCVYGCKSNYEVRTKAFKESKVKVPDVPTFSFPKDETLSAASIRKIPNKNLKVTNKKREIDSIIRHNYEAR